MCAYSYRTCSANPRHTPNKHLPIKHQPNRLQTVQTPALTHSKPSKKRMFVCCVAPEGHPHATNACQGHANRSKWHAKSTVQAPNRHATAAIVEKMRLSAQKCAQQSSKTPPARTHHTQTIKKFECWCSNASAAPHFNMKVVRFVRCGTGKLATRAYYSGNKRSPIAICAICATYGDNHEQHRVECEQCK